MMRDPTRGGRNSCSTVPPFGAGELFVVPKGVEHQPFAAQECKVMLVEPKGIVNTGSTGGTLTAPNDVWV